MQSYASPLKRSSVQSGLALQTGVSGQFPLEVQRRPLFGPPAQVPPHCELLVHELPASKPPTQTPAVQVPLLAVGQEPSST